MQPTVLDFTLSPQSTQKVHDALTCLSKFSELVSLEARYNQLCLSALNSTKSAYGAVSLDANQFFTGYKFVPGDDDPDDRFTCCLQVKALLSVFRQRYLDSKDKSTAISSCEVRLLSPNAPSSSHGTSSNEHRLQIRLFCNHGVVKTTKLTYNDSDVLHAIFDPTTAPYHWRLSSSLLKEYMEHFASRAEQLDISSSAANGRAAFTSFTEKLIEGKEILKQPLQTSVAADIADFDEFEVPDGVRVAVSFKDFKAISAHASSVEMSVDARYSLPGKPMLVSYAREGLEVKFTLMTAADGGTRGGGRIAMQRSGDTDRSRSRQATVPRHQGSESAQTQATAAAAVDESGDSSLYRQPSPRPQSSSYQQPSAPRQPSLPPHQPSQPSQPQPGESTNMWAPRSVPSPAPAPRPNPPPPRSAPPSASAPKPNPPRPKPTPLPPTPPPPDPPLFKPSDYTDSEDDEEDDGYGDNENSTHLGTIRDNERGPTQQVGWDTGVRADDITAPAGQKRSRMLMELDDEGEKGDGEEKEDGEETGVIPTRQESSDEEEEEGVGPTQQIFPPPKALF